MRHHVIISGTGRAGTTFLVQLLTALGLDTGFRESSPVYANCDGGLEADLRSATAPYFVKDPWLCDSLADVLKLGEVVIDHAIVPIRDLHSAAESRRDVSRRTGPDVYAAFGPVVPGGCWPSDRAEDQESLLARKLYALLETLAAHDVPTTLVSFPRLAMDPEYLYRKIGGCLPSSSYEAFTRAFRATSRPDKIHTFVRK
jgi:hypothetical protein